MGFGLGSLTRIVRRVVDPLDAVGRVRGLIDPKLPDNADEYARQQAARQQTIDRQVGDINAAYADPKREASLKGYLDAARTYYRDDLDEAKRKNDLQATFALARSGLAGGSRDADLRRSMGKSYIKGILEAERRAQGGYASLRQADQQSRQGLIQLALSGGNVTDAASRAYTSLNADLAGARASLTQQSLGDIFGDFAGIYSSSREAAGRRRADRWGLTTLGST